MTAADWLILISSKNYNSSKDTKTLRHRYAVFTISTDGVKGFITGQQRIGAVAELHHNVISFLSH